MKIEAYQDLANQGCNPHLLAEEFISEYFGKKEIVYPINPFRMLKDLNVNFVFREFSKAEGIYIPPICEDDIAIVGINIDRPIQRQRYTAVHELCHHIKDTKQSCVCEASMKNEIEKYADEFAAELLMPKHEFTKKVKEYVVNGVISEFDLLRIAQYFGISYEACLIRFNKLILSNKEKHLSIKKQVTKFHPIKQKERLKLYDSQLYKQLIDSIADEFDIQPDKFVCEVFKSEYIFYDSRMEGINIDKQCAGDIVTDLRLNKQSSKYCKEKNQNIIELAGLTFVYDYVFEHANEDISIYTTKELNRILYSTAPYPEHAGEFRKSNALVKGAKFETINYELIPIEMMQLGKTLDKIIENKLTSTSNYIEAVVKLHHRLTQIHPFRDGNGRTLRAFCNILLLRRNIPPIFFTDKSKTEYKDSLRIADIDNTYEPLNESFYKSLIRSFAILTSSNL